MIERLQLPADSLMHAITGSQHPGDALGFLGAVASLLEDLCPRLATDPTGLTTRGAEGLCFVIQILRMGIDETLCVLSPGCEKKIDTMRNL